VAGAVKRGATLDPTGRHRYALYREWDPDAPRIAFVTLNPSDEKTAFSARHFAAC